MNDGEDIMARLPAEVSTHILSVLDAESLLACAAVNDAWNEMTNRLPPDVWFQASSEAGINVKQEKYQEAREWKAFLSTMLPRLRFMRTSNIREMSFFTFENPVRAIYYLNERIAVAFEHSVKILDTLDIDYYAEFDCHFTPSLLKFDGNMLVAGSASGYISSWSITSRDHLRDYIAHGTMLFSFDFLTDYNVLASSHLNRNSTSDIFVWSMGRDGGFTRIEVGDKNIYRIILAVNSHTVDARERTFFLCGLASDCVLVWELKLQSRSFSLVQSMTLKVPCDPSLYRHVSSLQTVGFLLSGDELHFMALSQRSSRTVWVWNFITNELRYFESYDRILSLLGVGERYLMYKIRCTYYDCDAIRLIDKDSKKEKAIAGTNRINFTNEDSSCLDHTPWLYGLRGEGDYRVVFAYITEDEHTVKVARGKLKNILQDNVISNIAF